MFRILPPDVTKCVNPLHFQRSDSIKKIGSSILVPLFRVMTKQAREIGHTMARTAVGHQQWGQMTGQEQERAAATAIFAQPPVKQLSDGTQYDTDLRLVRESR